MFYKSLQSFKLLLLFFFYQLVLLITSLSCMHVRYFSTNNADNVIDRKKKKMRTGNELTSESRAFEKILLHVFIR